MQPDEYAGVFESFPSVDMATDFVKEQYAGVFKSFYDFARKYHGIDNLLAGSQVNPAAYKALYPIVVSGGSASVQTFFNPPLYLNGQDY